MTQKIPLSQGQFALVDDEDYDYLNQWKWHFQSKGYAHRSKTKSCKPVLMHRLIIKPARYMQVDHINGNKLDNRRINLRLCVNSENTKNKRIKKDKPFKGVFLIKYKNYERWKALIVCNYKPIYLGLFNSQIEAARAYNTAALKYHGEFAYLNSV